MKNFETFMKKLFAMVKSGRISEDAAVKLFIDSFLGTGTASGLSAVAGLENTPTAQCARKPMSRNDYIGFLKANPLSKTAKLAMKMTDMAEALELLPMESEWRAGAAVVDLLGDYRARPFARYIFNNEREAERDNKKDLLPCRRACFLQLSALMVEFGLLSAPKDAPTAIARYTFPSLELAETMSTPIQTATHTYRRGTDLAAHADPKAKVFTKELIGLIKECCTAYKQQAADSE